MLVPAAISEGTPKNSSKGSRIFPIANPTNPPSTPIKKEHIASTVASHNTKSGGKYRSLNVIVIVDDFIKGCSSGQPLQILGACMLLSILRKVAVPARLNLRFHQGGLGLLCQLCWCACWGE